MVNSFIHACLHALCLQLARHVTSRAKQELQAQQEKNRMAKQLAQKLHMQLADKQFFF
jgi:hypothetical protein